MKSGKILTTTLCLSACAIGLWKWGAFGSDTGESMRASEPVTPSRTNARIASGSEESSKDRADAQRAFIEQLARTMKAHAAESSETRSDYTIAMAPADLERDEAVQELYSEIYPTEAPRMFDEVIERQPRNRAWTEDTEAAANAALARLELPGTKLSAVDCGTTMCKVTLNHQSAEAEKTFWSSDFLAEGPWAGNLQGAPMPEDEMANGTRLYFVNGEGMRDFEAVAVSIRERATAALAGLADASALEGERG